MSLPNDVPSLKEHFGIPGNPSFFIDHTGTWGFLFVFQIKELGGRGWDSFVALETSCSPESVDKIVLPLYPEAAYHQSLHSKFACLL